MLALEAAGSAKDVDEEDDGKDYQYEADYPQEDHHYLYEENNFNKVDNNQEVHCNIKAYDYQEDYHLDKDDHKKDDNYYKVEHFQEHNYDLQGRYHNK